MINSICFFWGLFDELSTRITGLTNVLRFLRDLKKSKGEFFERENSGRYEKGIRRVAENVFGWGAHREIQPEFFV